MPNRIITIMTDFGVSSPYIAEMKGVMLSINPQANLVDVTHAIPPQDIRTGALTWPPVVSRFPAGSVHVAVVDPGVGSQRNILYASYRGQHFICPDNGLLTMLAAPRDGKDGLSCVRKLTASEYWLPEVSSTFHGRDIMAPVAAHLTNGAPPAQLGPELDNPVLLEIPEVRIEEKVVVGSIASFDSFGNLITDISGSLLSSSGANGKLRVVCGRYETAGIARTYKARRPGQLIALIGSTGLLELAIVNGSAAENLDVSVGAEVRVEWGNAPPQHGCKR